MRVTKTVREYIEKQVQERIIPRYQQRKADYEMIEQIKRDFLKGILTAAQNAAMNYLSSHQDEIRDVLDVSQFHCGKVYLHSYDPGIDFCDNERVNLLRSWRRDMDRDIKETVDNIIVTLELGGNKADLERLLSEI